KTRSRRWKPPASRYRRRLRASARRSSRRSRGKAVGIWQSAAGMIRLPIGEDRLPRTGDGAQGSEGSEMARQDQANDQFSLTSFLYGGNADYIEELHAAWQQDPSS